MKQILLFLALFLPICAFSQFYESFEGPELSSAWTGRRELFRIPAPGQLCFDGGRKSGTYTLGTPVAYSATMQWEASVSFGFNPSTANHARLYVYATGKPSDILFYIQIGHNDDNVSLYQWKGSADPVRVITGRKKILDSDRPAVELRLTMEENGQLWTLYTRLPEEAGFYREGTFRSAPLADLREGGNLILACCCKAAGKEEALFRFGPIRVSAALSPVAPDPDPDPDNPAPEVPGDDEPDGNTSLPVFESVTPLSLSTLQFCFSRPVSIDKARFTISGIGEAFRRTYADDTRKVVNAGFAAEMEVGRSYTIGWEGVTDTNGNAVTSGVREVSLEEEDGEPDDDPEETPGHPDKEEAYAVGTLLINEVMADPKGLTAFPETEYVELRNASASTVPLKNWAFLYGGKPVLLEAADLPAGGYVVLYKAGRALVPDGGGMKMPLDKFPALLANAGKDLQLQDPAGNLIDEVTYAKAKPAVSWERGDTGWHLSTDPRGGTPGSANSPVVSEPDEPEAPDKPGEDPVLPESTPVLPGEIIFNELLPNPFEGGSEYIELYNRSQHTLSLASLSIATRKTDGSLSTRYPLSSVPFTLPAGGYALLTKNAEGVASFYLISAPEVVHELRLPILANTSATLVLFQTKDEKVIDEVTYAKAWHAAWVKNEKGIALERIDPDRPSQEAANWTSAAETAGYGTPGYRNSQSGTGRPETPTGIEAPVYSEITGEYEIKYYLDQPGYSCRAWVYDAAGRRLAEVANQTLLGREGYFTWNGQGADGARLRPGVYLFYADLYHTGGKTRAYKRVFLAR